MTYEERFPPYPSPFKTSDGVVFVPMIQTGERVTIDDVITKATDWVLVVRCKDCKHRWKDGHAPLEDGHPDFTCDFEGSLDDDWFCADGERKEDEAD